VGILTLAERDWIQTVTKKHNVTVICPATSLISMALSILLNVTYSVPFCAGLSNNLSLPLIDNNMLRKNFLDRLLFRDMH